MPLLALRELEPALGRHDREEVSTRRPDAAARNAMDRSAARCDEAVAERDVAPVGAERGRPDCLPSHEDACAATAQVEQMQHIEADVRNRAEVDLPDRRGSRPRRRLRISRSDLHLLTASPRVPPRRARERRQRAQSPGDGVGRAGVPPRSAAPARAPRLPRSSARLRGEAPETPIRTRADSSIRRTSSSRRKPSCRATPSNSCAFASTALRGSASPATVTRRPRWNSSRPSSRRIRQRAQHRVRVHAEDSGEITRSRQLLTRPRLSLCNRSTDFTRHLIMEQSRVQP